MAEQQLVVFRLDSEEYALPVLKIREIIRYQGATKLPNAEPCLEGIINLRGKIIPIINLAKKFNFKKEKDIDDNSRVIIIENKIQDVGIIVNEVTEVLRIDESLIEPPPIKDRHKYIKGIGKTDTRMLMLLDLHELLDQEEADLVQKIV